MLPIQDENHVAEGLAYVIGQYKGDPNLAAMLTCLLNRVQDAEDMLWDVINSQLLASAPSGQALYQIADLVGAPRAGLSDAAILFLVNVWLLARKSHGTSEDLIGILAAAFPPVLGVAQFGYAEFFPAAYRATVWSVPAPALIAPLAQALQIARPPGVASSLAWGVDGVAATLFFGDSGDPFGVPPRAASSGSGLKDAVSGANPRGLLSTVGD